MYTGTAYMRFLKNEIICGLGLPEDWFILSTYMNNFIFNIEEYL